MPLFKRTPAELPDVAALSTLKTPFYVLFSDRSSALVLADWRDPETDVRMWRIRFEGARRAEDHPLGKLKAVIDQKLTSFVQPSVVSAEAS